MPVYGVSPTASIHGAAAAHADNLETVHASNFQQRVLSASGPVVVEFMSYGCPHCRKAEPVVQAVAASLAGKKKFFRVNVPAEPALTAQYGITGTPTFLMFLNGQLLKRVEGPMPEYNNILAMVNAPFAP